MRAIADSAVGAANLYFTLRASSAVDWTMLPGTVIADRYVITRLLGDGGMGSVYEGEHIAVGRKVAIKVLHPNFARKAAVVERFEREARAAGAIGHENIIDVIDFGVHDDAPFMVMEYLRGETLGNRLATEHKLSIESTCMVLGQVLSALSAAHAAGIVHRDLKPDNVFLLPRGGQRDFVKLLDFGISKFLDRDGRSLTQSGMLMGTPFYMAPEQAMAKPDVDGRADLYSAGVMLYELLTGVVPFDAESEAEILIKICQRVSEPPAPRALDSAIPADLDAVIRRAIAFDREARFQSAGELLEALRPFGAVGFSTPHDASGSFRALSGPAAIGTPTAWVTSPAPTLLEEDGAIRPPSRLRARRAWWAAVGAAVAIVGGGVAAVALWRGPVPVRATTQPDVAIELEGIPDDARVQLDGTPTAARSLRLRLGSTHRLSVSAPGRLPYEARLAAERSEVLRIALADAPPPPPAPMPVVVAPISGPAPVVDATPRHAQHGHVAASAHHDDASAPPPRGSLMAPTEEY